MAFSVVLLVMVNLGVWPAPDFCFALLSTVFQKAASGKNRN